MRGIEHPLPVRKPLVTGAPSPMSIALVTIKQVGPEQERCRAVEADDSRFARKRNIGDPPSVRREAILAPAAIAISRCRKRQCLRLSRLHIDQQELISRPIRRRSILIIIDSRRSQDSASIRAEEEIPIREETDF